MFLSLRKLRASICLPPLSPAISPSISLYLCLSLFLFHTGELKNWNRFCDLSVAIARVPYPTANRIGLQSQITWGSSVLLPDPQVGESVVGPTTFATVWELLWYNVLQFVGCLLRGSMVELMTNFSKRAYVTHCASHVCKHPLPTTQEMIYTLTSPDDWL